MPQRRPAPGPRPSRNGRPVWNIRHKRPHITVPAFVVRIESEVQVGEHAVLNHGMSYRAARASGGSRATTFDRDRWHGHVATHDGSGMVPVRSAVMSSRSLEADVASALERLSLSASPRAAVVLPCVYTQTPRSGGARAAEPRVTCRVGVCS